MRRNNSAGRSGGREESSDRKKPYTLREDKPATGYKKYRDADKSEAGWTKADGKPIRKRVGKKDEKKYSSAKPPREGGFTGNRPDKSFDDKNETTDRKPYREKSFGGDRNREERAPSRERNSDDRRESSDRKPYREKSLGGGRNREERAPSSERSSDNRRESSDRKPYRGKSFGGDKNREERAPSRERSTGDRRESSDGKPYREKSFGGDRVGSRDDRKSSGERTYRADKKNNESKPFGQFYKEKKSLSKNKTTRGESASRFSDKKFSDRKPTRSDSEDKSFADKDLKRPGKRERSKSTESTSTQTEGIRLNRFIANSGICSRREADELIEAGVISVNGNVVIELGTRESASDDIRYNGERMKSEKLVYLILNKPKDYITTSEDPQARKTVMELVKSAGKERIYPVGRLDRNTTGLLMLTNDGEMTKKLTHPSSNVFKVYHVELDKPLTKKDMDAIAEGVELEDGLMKVDEIAYDDGGKGDKTLVGVEIHSGKNRIVRRLFEHFEYEVKKLDRVIFAGITKKDLPRGRWRFLTEDEVNMLKVLTGSGKKAKASN